VWFDSHCHLDFEAFETDRAATWARARAVGVTEAFIPGVSLEQWPNLVPLRSLLEGVRVGVGLHPYFLHQVTAQERRLALSVLPEWYARLGACAVGECGLDSGIAKRGGLGLDEQAAILEQHLAVARELSAPLVLHVVGAHGRALSQLERFGPFAAGGVLHSYSGPAELVTRYCRLGFRFGFAGGITRLQAKKTHVALAAVPLERLLIETDAPDQAPLGFAQAESAGRRNEPSALLVVAARVAELRRMELDELAQLTTRNARQLFGE
jgi:TatD DNase family protein